MKVAPATSGERPRAENGNVKISFKRLFRKYLKIFLGNISKESVNQVGLNILKMDMEVK